MTTPFAVSATFRTAGLFVLWLALARWSVADMVAGLLAAALAGWASLTLLPPRPGRSRSLPALLQLALRFPGQSLAAGIDVARRALAPGLPLRPGFVLCRVGLRDETGRSAFRAFMSLQPGSIPVEDQPDGKLLIHCLDTQQPVEVNWRENEALFARAIGAANG